MNRTVFLPLLVALMFIAPLTTLAQSNTSIATDTAINATSAALPQAAASAASATDDASNSDDDQAFQQMDQAERKRIADGRTAAYARYGEDQRACWQRFAVNACLDQARDRRRATLDALRHDELALNAQERQRRTTARLAEIAQKQAESAERNSQHNANTPTSPASEVQ